MYRYGVGLLVVGVVFLLALPCASAAALPDRAPRHKQTAQTAASVPASAPVRYVGGPHARFGARGSYSSTSQNWAGYDVLGAGIKSVSATWIQPAVVADPTADADSSFWVGLDGDGSSTVEQCGTEADDHYGIVSYYAWYEIYPEPEVRVGLAVSPGDQITATVTTDGAGSFTMTVTDGTTGRHSQTTRLSAGAQSASAEVIAEAPTNGSTGDIYPLANFGTVDFTGCSFDGQPISAFTWNQIDMVSADGSTTLASTSALGSDGASFSVASYPAPVSDVTPPTTTASGADQLWHRSAVALTFAASDNPGGSGVAYTDYSVDGGPWTVGNSVTIAAPSSHTNDGTHTISYSSTDSADNVEAVQSCQVRIDTLGPVCAARNVTVRRGKTCRLSFKVHDHLSPEVTRLVRITTRSGRVLRHWSWGYGTNYAGYRYIRYTCKLAKGKYLVRIYAKDLAGNVQSVIGKAHLYVK